jgi:hypothetical protein
LITIESLSGGANVPYAALRQSYFPESSRMLSELAVARMKITNHSPELSSMAVRARRPAPRSAWLLAAALGLAAGAVQAQDDHFDYESEAAPLGSGATDPAVFATLLPNTNVVRRSLIQSAIAAAMTAQADTTPKTIVPASAPAIVNPNLRPIRMDSGVAASTPSLLQLDSGQVVQVHANGLPSPNGPDRDPLVRVMPRAVNPLDVTVGARWGAEDRIPVPLISQIAWDAHADVLSGAPAPRAGNVRRSLRVTAQWDTPEDLKIGFTPGVERGGGMIFEHYVAGLQASTVDKTQAVRWRSFVEVSGEKLAPNNIIDNCTAQVHAGASYLPTSSTSLDISVTRGTMAVSDLQSSVGLSVHF